MVSSWRAAGLTPARPWQRRALASTCGGRHRWSEARARRIYGCTYLPIFGTSRPLPGRGMAIANFGAARAGSSPPLPLRSSLRLYRGHSPQWSPDEPSQSSCFLRPACGGSASNSPLNYRNARKPLAERLRFDAGPRGSRGEGACLLRRTSGDVARGRTVWPARPAPAARSVVFFGMPRAWRTLSLGLEV